MSFRHRVLEAGYFPRELPPPFTTHSFADFADAKPNYIQNLWSPFSPKKGYVTKLVRHHLAVVGRNRRVLSIPNPINQLRLVQALEMHFAQVFTAAWKSPISASKPHFQYSQARAIVPQQDFTGISRLKAKARAVARYILITDVTRFYPSIYTHSISWALHTKEVAKKNKGPNLAGNVLDKIIREAQDGQTIGIPIGPDTSLVIAEIILSAVDNDACGAGLGFRSYDDYELPGVTKGQCEQALVRLETALFEKELVGNVSKTEILELPMAIEDEWVAVLRKFEFGRTASAQLKDLNAFFSRAFEFAGRFAGKPVLRYAVAMMRSTPIHTANWQQVQRLMAQAATHEPEVLPWALACLNYYETESFPVDRELLQKLLEEVLRGYAARKLGSEVAWCIWGFLQFGIDIPANCVELAVALGDDVVSLILLDARRKGLINAKRALSHLGKVVDRRAFEEEHWLLAYEGIRKGWLRPRGSGVAAFRANAHVTDLLQSGVTFYDSRWTADATARHIFGTPPWLLYQLPSEEDEEGDEEAGDYLGFGTQP